MGSDPPVVGECLDRARRALRASDPLAAIACARTALSISPEDAGALELLGIAECQAGDCAAACQALDRAAQIDPRRATIHLNYALVLDYSGQMDEAMEEVKAALFVKPDYGRALGLHEDLARRLKDRRTYGDGGFAVTRNGNDPFEAPPPEWAKIKCASCGAMNFITARTCCRCGSYLPEEEEVQTVE